MASLQDHIQSLQSLSLAEAIEKIALLIPGLTAISKPEYGYWVEHPNYTGTGNLNDIGRLWLALGRKCYSEHAPLQVRLTHQSMDDPIYEIYGSTYDILKRGLADGTIELPPVDGSMGCACCAGEPDATILAGFHENEALYFDHEEYKALWGNQQNVGERYGASIHAIAASREQVEEAIARSSAGIHSML